jgi:hypothetical protein
MPRPAAWQRTLDEARRQALVAIDFYNRPGDRRSLGDFIVHIHLAWQNLLHAHRMRRNEEIYYRNKRGWFERNPDGSKKTWDLTQCLKHEFKENDPIRSNIKFFIGLRNHVEHQFQDSILAVTSAEAHACIINFESELISRFGDEATLGVELRFPVFVQALKPPDYDEQQNLRRSLPAATQTYITAFQEDLTNEVSSDARFAYRLLLIPMKGPKTKADAALNFVRQDDLTQEEIQELLGSQGSVLLSEKFREATDVDAFLPGTAAKMVAEAIPYDFGVNDFTRLRKKWEIGPESSASMKLLPKSDDYCLYSQAFNRYTYRRSLVERMIRELRTAEGYSSALSKEVQSEQ